MKLPKVFEVVHHGNEYLLKEADFSNTEDDEFENEEDFEEWLPLQYCVESLPYQFVLVCGRHVSYYYDEEHLKSEWEDDFIDRLLKEGSFYDDEEDMRFELHRLKLPRDCRLMFSI